MAVIAYRAEEGRRQAFLKYEFILLEKVNYPIFLLCKVIVNAL